MKPPIPSNETKRLDALRRYRILDTAAEPMFDDVALVASTICQTPIALMTLVDSDRQWLKAKVGLDVSETPREHAFCAYTILDKEPMVVEDATDDERFANNPLATSAPHIRFYAGAPLIDSDGNALGSLCVIDRKPRKISDRQKDGFGGTCTRHHCTSRTASGIRRPGRRPLDLKNIRGLLPICSHCKGIRNDDGYWQKLEDYIRTHSEADFSHSVCPACVKTHHPDVYDKLRDKGMA